MARDLTCLKGDCVGPDAPVRAGERSSPGLALADARTAELRSAGRARAPAATCSYWVRIPAVRLVHLALLVGCASLLFAQTRKPSSPPSASRVLSVKVTGSKRYTPDRIIAATGLQRGQSATEDDFKAVTQQLGESGAFSNVAYTFQFSPEGIKLELQVVDS